MRSFFSIVILLSLLGPRWAAAQELPDSISFPGFEQPRLAFNGDGVFYQLFRDHLRIIDYRSRRLDTTTIDLPESLAGKLMVDPNCQVAGDTFQLFFEEYDPPTGQYNFHLLRFAAGEALSHDTYRKRYAFSNPRYYLVNDHTVLSFWSGKESYFIHYDLKKGREVYRTPAQAFVQNPGASMFSWDSGFGYRGDTSVFLIRESSRKEFLVCRHEPRRKTQTQFKLTLPEMGDGWSCSQVMVDGHMAYTFFGGYEGPIEGGPREKRVEYLFQLDTDRQLARSLDLTPFLPTNYKQGPKLARVFDRGDHLLLAFTYQWGMFPTETKLPHRQVTIKVDKANLTAEVLHTEDSRFPKFFFYYGDRVMVQSIVHGLTPSDTRMVFELREE